ncbi:MAG: glycosyltransferase family 9 protein [Enterovibrio sp.]
MALINQLQLGRDKLRRQIGRWLFDKTHAPMATNDTQSPSTEKVVLIRWDAKLGDAIVSSWVAREIHKHLPEREVWVVTTSAMAPLFRDHFDCDKVLEIAKRPNYRDLAALAIELGRVGYLVHFGNALKMKDIYFLSQVKARHIAGMDDELNCIDIKLGAQTQASHFSDKFAALLAQMGVNDPDQRYIIPRANAWESELAHWWPKETGVLAFNPYGSGSARRLSADNIKAMLRIMLSSCNAPICLLFPPELAQEARQIASELNEARLLWCPAALSVGTLFTQLRHSSALVSVDTATVHIASGLNLPILGLYNPDLGGGNQNYTQWHPNHPDATVLFSKSTSEQQINSLDLNEFACTFSDWVKPIRALHVAPQAEAETKPEPELKQNSESQAAGDTER